LLNGANFSLLDRSQADIIGDLERLLTPIAQSRNTYLIDLTIRGERGGKVVEIFLDGDSGVSADTCASVSRELSQQLDLAGLFHGRYQLIVSSPGLDRPLKYARQYPKHIGRRLKVVYREESNSGTAEGILSGVTEQDIVLDLADGRKLKLGFGQLIEARVLPAW